MQGPVSIEVEVTVFVEASAKPLLVDRATMNIQQFHLLAQNEADCVSLNAM